MSNFSNLSRQIVPYNITGLQDINVNTINGTTPFNGVIANTNYPLSFNTTTGILSQTPIGQSVETSATPSFSRINLTGTPSITTTSSTLHIRPSSFTTRFNNDGVKGFIEIECVGTTTSGQVLFYTKEGTLRALMRADPSYFYFFNLGSPVGCVFYTLGSVIFYCSFGQATGTGEIVFKDNNIEIFVVDAIRGLMMKNSLPIQSVSGTSLILNAPSGQQINFNINNSNKFYVNSSGIYAISLPSATQTNILGYDTTTGQITYQPPTVPLSITVNNIASDSTNNLSLSSANNNINITAMSAIGGTGAGNINIYYKRYLSFYYDSSSVEIIRFQSTGIIFPNQTTTGITETPIRFTSTGPSYIQNNLGPVGFTCGGNNILSVNGTTSTGTINAIINNVNILKVSLADGLTTDKITSNTATDLVLNAPTSQKVNFNINNSNIGFLNSSGLYINKITSKTPVDNLFLDSQADLVLNAATSQEIYFNINSSNIGFINSSGLTMNNIASNTAQHLNFNVPTTKSIIFNVNNNNVLSINNTAGPQISSLSSITLNSTPGSAITLNCGLGSISISSTAGASIDSTLEVVGLLTQLFPVNVWYKSYRATYPSPTIMNATSSTNFNNVGSAVSVNTTSFFNYDLCNATAQNWTPFWGTSTASQRGFLYFPYKGVYNIQWSFSVNTDIQCVATINKNWSLSNWSSAIPSDDITALSCLDTSPNTLYNSTISATVRIDTAGSSGDYVCFCLYNFTANTTVSGNNFRGPLIINKIG